MSDPMTDSEFLNVTAHYLQTETDAFPWDRFDLIQQRAFIKSKLEWYRSVRNQLLELVNDRQKADAIWRNEIENLADYEQKLRVFKSALIGSGLIDKKAAAGIETRFEDPSRKALLLENEKKERELQQALKWILDCSADKERARLIYNRMPESPLDETRLNNFTKLLVDQKQLGLEWMPGRRVGSIFDHLARLVTGKR